MKFFRNPEIKQGLFCYTAAAAFFTAAGFFFGNKCGFLVLFLCIFFTFLHFFYTYQRYRSISRLSQSINGILHGADFLDFSDYSEGELSILKIELNKMILRLREQKDALKRDKLSLAASLADISHQIRTPLTSIHLVLSLLSDPDLTSSKRRELVQQLTMLLSRIDWLIEALLKISRLDAGTVTFQTESVPAAKAILAALKPLEIPMELRELKVTRSSQTGREYFLGDFSWTVEALGNILKNCMEHTPSGGEIRISTLQNAIFTEIVIEDNGPGFSSEDIPRLFERFYKGSNSKEQSIGIGLALARMILTSQNGTVKAENRPEGGARFILRFYDRIVT